MRLPPAGQIMNGVILLTITTLVLLTYLVIKLSVTVLRMRAVITMQRETLNRQSKTIGTDNREIQARLDAIDLEVNEMITDACKGKPIQPRRLDS